MAKSEKIQLQNNINVMNIVLFTIFLGKKVKKVKKIGSFLGIWLCSAWFSVVLAQKSGYIINRPLN